MTTETKPRFRWPCWLVGHRPTVTMLATEGHDTYEEQCRNCSKRRMFVIKNDGRHNMDRWAT